MVLAVDVNGDGAPDLVDAGGRVFLNRGDGTFASSIQLSLGLTVSFYYAEAGDLNADGRADLVVPGGGYVYVLLASDNDTFLAPVPYPSVNSPREVAIADLNGDGIPDLAVGAGIDRIGIMLGLGPVRSRTGVTSSRETTVLRQLLTCDCNGDGKVDLLRSYHGSPNFRVVKLLRGRSDGTFEAAEDYATIVDAMWLLLTDLNRDGRPDI